MRVLHILDHSPPLHTAYSLRAVSLLRQQRALGWHTIQLTGPAQGKVETEDRNRDGWHFFRTDPGNGLMPPALLAGRMARRICHAITLARPGIVHAHPPVLNAVAALRAARQAGLPVVIGMPGRLHSHGVKDWMVRALEVRAARSAAAVVTDTLAMRSWLIAGGVEPRRISIVPPSVSAPAAASDSPRAGVRSAPLVHCPGAVEACTVLRAALPALRAAFPGLQLGFTGANNADADMLLFPEPASPSLVAPIRLLEAMARGALVVASDTAMHRELVEHGRNGILFESGNAAALVEAVLGMLAEPECMRQLRGCARAFALRERSWEAAARLYGRLYEELIENGGR
ncbi:glycosyltransferase family 4 protein [Massilia cavernae]|uniref:Glycosyltransferase n=1 Tax=Massilia cavernae TaxID=2320864 RepID=A0A418Y8C9_9BURK|nr:glycosyltransferase family 4 protein [Massilia cavernae]RJG27624.1 glycosyltransferase [Massilia cavernae]